jgi:chaperonin GroEL
MCNSGLDNKEIISKIKENTYNIIYDINTSTYEKINKTNVIDSTNVILNSVLNAISISSMLLTTNCLIINEYKNNLDKNHMEL